MNKQETVKEDGRALIYYTFPSDGEAGRVPRSTDENAEADHV